MFAATHRQVYGCCDEGRFANEHDKRLGQGRIQRACDSCFLRKFKCRPIAQISGLLAKSPSFARKNDWPASTLLSSDGTSLI